MGWLVRARPNRGFGMPSTDPAFYTTNFPTVGNPMVDDGGWTNGIDPFSTPVQISSAGKCHGTQTLATFDDSQAWRTSNYAANQYAQITVQMAPGLDGTNREVEVLLRMNHVAQFTSLFGQCQTTGYEINWQHQGGYLILGRFKMAEVDRIATPNAPVNGDVFKVTVVQNGSNQPTFQVIINGVAQVFQNSGTTTAVDAAASPVQSGHPGLGFYRDSPALNSEFWATNFTAGDI